MDLNIPSKYDFLCPMFVPGKNGSTISADFVTYPNPNDILTRGGELYAIWNADKGLWDIDHDFAFSEIDSYIRECYKKVTASNESGSVTALYARNSSSKVLDRFVHYTRDVLPEKRINGHTISMNSKLVFKDDPANREDYATQRLPYNLVRGEHPCFDKIINTLYDPEEAHKIIWSIGAIVSGESVDIQKFLVLYGPAGAGKSTILNIVEQLFEGYTCAFNAKSLGQSNNTFALEAFKNNPLVAIQHDGDLSHIVDNTILNSLVSHETMMINPKYGKQYPMKFNSFLMMGTNSPVKITDQKSGLLRRLIDCKPSGRKLTRDEYKKCTLGIKWERGAIAEYCMQVYLDNPSAYDDYRPIEMISITNDFYNFVLDNINSLDKEEVSLGYAYKLYKEYSQEGNMEPVSRTKFREELKNYYKSYENNIFRGFLNEIFVIKEVKTKVDKKWECPDWLELKEQESVFDDDCCDLPAQYANSEGTPRAAWDNVKTTLNDILTNKVHYVKVPINHIIIDFDVKVDGQKSLEENIKLASKFPPTYAEVSKSGGGLHLHYIYDGDPNELSALYAPNIEIKVYKGKTALRRMLTLCNSHPISHITDGLPLKDKKGDGDTLSVMSYENEKHIRNIIEKCLRREMNLPSTVSHVSLIKKTLDEAYEQGIDYDVSDMKEDIIEFAMESHNSSDVALKMVTQMKFSHVDDKRAFIEADPTDDTPIVFYDVEVFMNLFIVCWCYDLPDATIQVLINPSPEDMKAFMKFKLVGFNNTNYDNHIIYARSLGYTLRELYQLSYDIVHNLSKGFYQAKHISYTDIYDFASTKQSLKKWEIEMGMDHLELGLPWDQPVDESLWKKVGEYCKWDVTATKALFHYKPIVSDWIGRQILAEISGLTVNHSNNDHSIAIIFGDNKNADLVYTDLATGEKFYDGLPYESNVDPNVIQAFPGYEWKLGEDGKMHNMYRGMDMSKGGLVIVNEGYYENVMLLDIESMHPTSMKQLDIFGAFTQRFVDIVNLRLELKHKNFENVAKMFDGKLEKYLDDPEKLDGCKQALKMVINPVYGLTSAPFKNPFKDMRNVNNIVALRGALFMKTLWDEVVKLGYTPIHIKTDSIKIANGDEFIKNFCMEFAQKYGYKFAHEATYDKFCIVNKAVYIAHSCWGDHCGEWTATGTQFAVPYVFKSLFSKEEITFDDYSNVFNSKAGDIYLDFNEDLPNVEILEKERDALTTQIKKAPEKRAKKFVDIPTEELIAQREELARQICDGHEYVFVGKVGRFTPVKDGTGGGLLTVIKNKAEASKGAENPSRVTNSSGHLTGKDYRWKESCTIQTLGISDQIESAYYQELADEAVQTIEQYVPFEDFVCLDNSPSLV